VVPSTSLNDNVKLVIDLSDDSCGEIEDTPPIAKEKCSIELKLDLKHGLAADLPIAESHPSPALSDRKRSWADIATYVISQ
jgi:hypothetical protein